jgi:hypothetical protein
VVATTKESVDFPTPPLALATVMMATKHSLPRTTAVTEDRELLLTAQRSVLCIDPKGDIRRCATCAWARRTRDGLRGTVRLRLRVLRIGGSRHVAIYHFSAQVISRASGRSAVAAAAYRSASALPDEREARTHDFSGKADVVHSEILLPAGAPERWADRAVLWNEVEATEKRKDAQLAREIEFAVPRELSRAQAVALAREFGAEQFVSRGMVADLNVHWPVDGRVGGPSGA